jgi:hypothetical protein
MVVILVMVVLCNGSVLTPPSFLFRAMPRLEMPLNELNLKKKKCHMYASGGQVIKHLAFSVAGKLDSHIVLPLMRVL